jgi:hypothetical protein
MWTNSLPPGLSQPRCAPAARVVAHVLEHLDRHARGRSAFGRGQLIDVAGQDLDVVRPRSALAEDELALRARVRDAGDARIREALGHPQRQRTPAAAEFEDALAVGQLGALAVQRSMCSSAWSSDSRPSGSSSSNTSGVCPGAAGRSAAAPRSAARWRRRSRSPSDSRAIRQCAHGSARTSRRHIRRAGAARTGGGCRSGSIRRGRARVRSGTWHSATDKESWRRTIAPQAPRRAASSVVVDERRGNQGISMLVLRWYSR